MSAAAVLRAARAAGVKLAIDGNDLLLDAATMPPASVVDALYPNNSTGRRIQRWIGPFKNRLRELIAGVITLRKTGGQQQ
jgi:hypothetical protein